jgi:hypothetical protein
MHTRERKKSKQASKQESNASDLCVCFRVDVTVVILFGVVLLLLLLFSALAALFLCSAFCYRLRSR